MKRRTGQSERKKRRSGLLDLAGVAALCAGAVVLALGTGVQLGIDGAIDREVIPQGTYIDDVGLGGMTAQQAYDIINNSRLCDMDEFSITLEGVGISETWSADDVGVACNVGDIIQQASYPNYDGALLDAMDTYASMQAEKRYYSSSSIDAGRVRALLEKLAARVYQTPVDANAAFDNSSETFFFTQEADGRELDVRSIAEDILAEFDPYLLTPIVVDLDKYAVNIAPEVTRAELRANTVLVGECVTETTSNEDRNVNIQLMCAAADGICLMPGEQLSLNELVGKRTEEKGFRYAGAIVDGKLEDDVGGGICQMAGTLYNAALLADIEIVERVKHTYPSNYLPLGLDATLNWNNKDLVIKNNTSYPIYISTKFSDNKVTARIYGRPLPDGMTVRLRSEVLKEVEPGNAELILTNDLLPGERHVKQTALNGYEVAVYKEYWKDEQILYQQKITHDNYQPRNAIILVGSGINK